MKRTMITVSATLACLALVASVWFTYQWKSYTDARSYAGGQSGAYLFGPSGITNEKGEALTRQQLLDYMLQELVTKNPDLGFTIKDK